MDFAKLVTEYLNQKTEGDPSFIVSEEALAFVDLMRSDDMDRRASNVEQQTNADARGEPSLEQVTSEPVSDPTSKLHEPAESEEPTQYEGQITEPAAVFSDVALGEPSAAGSLPPMPDQDTTPAPSEIFSAEPMPSEPSEVFSAEPLIPEPQQRIDDPGPPPEPASVFTENELPVATNQAIQEEGVTVVENPGLRSETTILAPESMPDFEELLQSFDRDYHPPDPPAGDEELIPEMDERPDTEPMQNTTEFCESMMADILTTHLAYDRRGA